MAWTFWGMQNLHTRVWGNSQERRFGSQRPNGTTDHELQASAQPWQLLPCKEAHNIKFLFLHMYVHFVQIHFIT